MDKARSKAPEYWLLAWSALFVAGSVASWYVYAFHGAQASWMVFSWVMIVLAAGFAVLWLLAYGKQYGAFSLGWISFRAWCGLIFGWVAYMLIANNRTFEPWLLAGCLAVMVLVLLAPTLAKLPRTK